MSITYSTWNSADKSAVISLSGGDLTAAADGTNWGGVRATGAYKSSGKWFWEVTVNTVGSPKIGILTDAGSVASGDYVGKTTFGWAIDDTGAKWTNASSTGYASAVSAGTVVGIALDLGAGEITYYIDGVSQGVAFTGITGNILPAVSGGFAVSNFTANFGATAFAYSVPGGYNSGWYEEIVDSTGIGNMQDYLTVGDGMSRSEKAW